MYQEDYLAHHGIRGMKWGVRRFQKPDGTRTSAGKARDKRTRKKRKGLSKNQKALLKAAGMTALGVGLGTAAIYGADKMMDAETEKYRRAADAAARERVKAQAQADAYRRAREAHEKQYREYQANSQRNQSGPNANQNRTNDQQRQARDTPRGANTSTRDDRKRREDQVKASGQKVDLGAARKRVQNLRDRVAQAQKDGTLTPDLIAELKDAQAQVRVAKQQSTAQHGAVWIINADDNYLMHHGIRGMKWGVRRFQNASGSLTDAGRRRYANFVQNRQNRRAEKQEAKAARKQARSNKLNSVKERLTSDSAKAKYKKVAKGAAIAAGLAAAGYGTTLIAQGVRDQKNINKARDLANSIIANDKSFSKLGEAGKDKVRKELMSENLSRMADNRANKKVARKRMRSDFVQAVKDPTAGFDRSYVRNRAASGYYDFDQRKIISSNKDQWLKDNRDRLKDLGRKADDPEKYARKQEIKREKARKAAEEAMKKAAEERRAKAAESWANLGKYNR